MKKFFIIMILSAISMVGFAQNKTFVKNAEMPKTEAFKYNVFSNIKPTKANMTYVDFTNQNVVSAKKTVRKDKEQTDLYGTYLEDITEDGVSYSIPVTCDAYEVTSEGETYVYMLFQKAYQAVGDSVLADFNETNEGKVTVYSGQHIGDYTYNSTTYGLYIYAIKSNGDSFDFDVNDEEETYNNLVYTVHEDENGTYLSLDNEGYVVMVYDKEAQEFLGYMLYSLDGDVLNLSNATFSYSSCYPSNGTWSNWEATEERVFVENFGDACVVHGFNGMFLMNINLYPQENKAAIPNAQAMYYYSSQDLTFSFYAIHDSSVDCDDASYESVGYYNTENGYMCFGDLNLESGEINSWDYFAFCTYYDPSNGAYWVGEFAALQLVPDEWTKPDGIGTVVRNSNTSNVVYDVMGRHIHNKVQNGVYIVNGKKVIK